MTALAGFAVLWILAGVPVVGGMDRRRAEHQAVLFWSWWCFGCGYALAWWLS